MAPSLRLSPPLRAAERIFRGRVEFAAHGPSRPEKLSSICDAVGRTPLVRLRAIDADFPGVELWAKLEFTNPGGSVKDRPALNMIVAAEESGAIRSGVTLLDSTSGNTGVALALYGAARGHRVALVMPENVSSVRKALLRAFGAEIIYSDPMEGSDGAIRHAHTLIEGEPERYLYLNQYHNPANWRAHLEGTGPEIWAATQGRVSHFVAGIGTSGTVMGTGRYLKRMRSEVIVVGVEPDDPFHGLEGLKHLESSIVPGIYDAAVLDRTEFIDTDRGWAMAERVRDAEGIQVGNSGGAALQAAVNLAGEVAEAGATAVIVTIFPDHASRYLEFA